MVARQGPGQGFAGLAGAAAGHSIKRSMSGAATKMLASCENVLPTAPLASLPAAISLLPSVRVSTSWAPSPVQSHPATAPAFARTRADLSSGGRALAGNQKGFRGLVLPGDGRSARTGIHASCVGVPDGLGSVSDRVAAQGVSHQSLQTYLPAGSSTGPAIHISARRDLIVRPPNSRTCPTRVGGGFSPSTYGPEQLCAPTPSWCQLARLRLRVHTARLMMPGLRRPRHFSVRRTIGMLNAGMFLVNPR